MTTAAAVAVGGGAVAAGQEGRADARPSVAYQWVDVGLEVTARQIERIGARPTVISRQHGMFTTAMFDAWAAYDPRADATTQGPELRRPPQERTDRNREIAIGHAAFGVLANQFPEERAYLAEQMGVFGLDPANTTTDVTTPQGVGNVAAARVIAARSNDGSNERGDRPGSIGGPFSDYTGYTPVNPPDRIVDPDRWQPIVVPTANGPVTQRYLTPFWGEVTPFGLQSGGQFRPGPPPRVGSEQLAREVQENIDLNASLTVEQKAIVEFMRDGPRSTAQSGHWLDFAQEISLRDKNRLDEDVLLFFAVGVNNMDAFIAAWDAKRFYDASRPYTLVRYYAAGQQIRNWGGPGQGSRTVAAEDWKPYSPLTFPTPGFPGYVSGHSTVSAASARTLELVTGSTRWRGSETRVAGQLTEPGFPCATIMQVEGQPAPSPDLSCEVTLNWDTFRGLAEIAGTSRVLGGYHIQADNVAGLDLGNRVADWNWPIIRSYVTGTAR
jgi:hypothetical protein